MQFQRFGDRYQVRLESGDELMASLMRLAESESIRYAALSGLGAVRSVTLGYFNAESRQYETQQFEEQLELVSLTGNISLREGRPFAHIHASLGRRDLSVIGGHVMDATTRPTIEIWLRREDASVERVPDEESGLALMELPERG